MNKLPLNKNWHVFQDVHDTGEKLQVFQPSWNAADSFFTCLSDWEAIDRLDYLQLLFSQTPYHGRELRYFNAAPWWYKNEFMVTGEQAGMNATLKFEGVDYYCKVWLNGQFLGEHEGYFAPFTFDVSSLLKIDQPNTLVVKVWSPLDFNTVHISQMGMDLGTMLRFLTCEKSMIKGTYEHADGFIQRDINPVGIYRDVSIEFSPNIRVSGEPLILTDLSADKRSAIVRMQIPVSMSSDGTAITYQLSLIDDETGVLQASEQLEFILDKAESQISISTVLHNPKLWNCWDHGGARCYTIQAELLSGQAKPIKISRKIGFREIELLRSEHETTFVINQQRVYTRGASYFPEVYLSKMSRERYQRDILAMKAAGFNTIRIHVHVARPEFYELCDELGMLVIQDSDITWFYPMTDSFVQRALAVFGDMVRLLRNHPSIICWVCMNEPDLWALEKERGRIEFENTPPSMMTVCPGPQLVELVRELDPTRPYIKGSHFKDDPESGDEHNYVGSLRGEETHYTNLYGENFKLTTEFGFDLPAIPENLAEYKAVFNKIRPVFDDAEAYQSLYDYRYWYFKYAMEYHRITKNRPCSGYIQFLFSDITPQSFYGIYDWWGTPKQDLNVFFESNQPAGIFMEFKDAPIALWAVNDHPWSLGECRAEWHVTDGSGNLKDGGQVDFTFGPGSAIRLSDLNFKTDSESPCQVILTIKDCQNNLITRNVYQNPFKYRAHPKGHPMRVDQELGVRLYWA